MRCYMKWNKQLVLVVGLLVLVGETIAEERFFFDMPRGWAAIKGVRLLLKLKN